MCILDPKPFIVYGEMQLCPMICLTDGSVYTIFALIDHSPVGRIHSEEWA